MSSADAPITLVATRWRVPQGQEEAAMGLRRARRRCRAVLDRARVPAYTTVEELCDRLGRQRGRPIVLIPRDTAAGQRSGEFQQHLTEDRIYYPKSTSEAHQAFIICHELAHLLLAHVPQMEALDSKVVRTILGRTHYEDPAEQQAEILGTLLWQRLALVPVTAEIMTLEHRGSGHV
ncbi:ImmA/IrrE family metallo-endopeptidase [Streptomyces chrestomyceticus]|uniref:ImmA/IrrE family metallo-endopeptidase n=1 Tax=Streptomyces chrestomyceticus TaxID=68185 RepID=UPI0035A900ED